MLGVPADGAHRPGLDHRRLGTAGQDGILGHRDDVVHVALVVQQVQDLRSRKAAVEAHKEARLGEGFAQEFEEPPQHPARAARRRGIAGPEHRRAQVLLGLVLEGDERQQRQIAPGVVVAVEERQLLRPMRRIVGRIEIDRDPPRPAVPPLAVPFDDHFGEGDAHVVQRLRAVVIFEARDRGLRGQRGPVHRVAPEQQFVHRIVGQSVRVIRVRIPAGQPKDALRQQITQRMLDLPGLAIVDQAAREAVDQPIAPVGGVQQHGAAVGARVRLIEGGDEGAIEEVRKQDSLCYRRLVQRNRLRVGKRRLSTA